jgi:hypothetical protein
MAEASQAPQGVHLLVVVGLQMLFQLVDQKETLAANETLMWKNFNDVWILQHL